jgi:mannose-6-phosphate isomerase-like protein (cupin superfamily)
MDDWHVTLQQARDAKLPPGRLSSLLMSHGTMTLRFYQPRGQDSQVPHDQDEIYVVASGSGTVVSGPREDALQSRRFGPGDAIFVPAGHIHRFTDFTSDFATWVIFWGRKGGEA